MRHGACRLTYERDTGPKGLCSWLVVPTIPHARGYHSSGYASLILGWVKVMGNSVLPFLRSLACSVVLLTSAQAQAQNTTIGSQAGQQVGASHDPSCAATIYSADNCGPCQALKARIQNNPDQYGCNAIT